MAKKKEIIHFTQKQKEIVFGTLLGDASLQTFSKGKTWRLRYLQGIKHKEYLFHLYDEFGVFCGTPPKYQKTVKGGYERYYFNTLTHPDLKEFGDFFYLNKRKGLLNKSDFFKQYFTPRAIAYWYMDDGSKVKQSNTYVLCTDNFTKDELLVFKSYFISMYDIHISFKKKYSNLRIYIPVAYAQAFRDLIDPFILPSMRHKF